MSRNPWTLDRKINVVRSKIAKLQTELKGLEEAKAKQEAERKSKETVIKDLVSKLTAQPVEQIQMILDQINGTTPPAAHAPAN